jgi:two-component system, NtrC family, response regulator AtoC
MTPRFRPLPPPDDDQVLLELLQRLDERQCPTSDLLERFIAENLSLTASEEVLTHLRQCVTCLNTLARLQSLDFAQEAAPPAVWRQSGDREPMVLLAKLLLGESPAMIELNEQVARLVQNFGNDGDRRLPPVLIEGESGAGKSVLGRAMHRVSRRAGDPFVDINCAAIPHALVETELFGFERGAFTNAHQSRSGALQQAHRGTLFLEEIDAMPPTVQAQLLSAIEDRSVRRLGSTRSEPVDVWIIAASSRDLEQALWDRSLRQDLYHRLAPVTLRVPPLRDRGSDILLLAEHFLKRACESYRLPFKILSTEARSALLEYGWPGNVRELENVIERAALISDNELITSRAVLSPQQTIPSPWPTKRPDLGDADRQRLLAVWREAGGNLSRAAALLGVSRNTLRYRLHKLNILSEDR